MDKPKNTIEYTLTQLREIGAQLEELTELFEKKLDEFRTICTNVKWTGLELEDYYEKLQKMIMDMASPKEAEE